VVHDYLANPALLALCPANCRRVYVGKSGGSHSMPQEQIAKLLVDLAVEFGSGAHCIVRLKGGDPYVFGRGGEEGQTLAAAGVPFVVVPGITAGIAGPAYAGIPVTHRDFTSTVTFVTGHERADAAAEAAAGRVQYSVLAKLGGTLVFYMGVKHLPTIAAELVRGGLPAETPAAMVRWATTARQQTVLATLGTLPAAAQAAGMGAPAITIIGKVAQLRDTLNWFERRPLFGRTVVVTRSRQQVSTLAAELAALGARVLEAPTIAIEPNPPTPELTDALHNAGRFACVVFTSANGVDATWSALRAMHLDSRALAAPIAAVGPATAAALERIGIVPECLPDSYTSDALAAALRGTPALQSAFAAGRPVLLLRAEIARPALRQALEQAGAAVTDIPLYRTVRPAALPEETLQALTE
jgi:uroporphyrinogen III methyltransferase/synthase